MRNLQCLLFIVLCVQAYAQNKLDYYQLRTYNSSLLLNIEQESNRSTYTFTDYGNQMNSNQSIESRYLYHSQEFVEELNLYFFPRRIYSLQNLRFHQPDPKSQYFSPYLFVGADPINYVDRDGQEGYPLVLYQVDHTEPGGEDMSLRDFKAAVPDAYYVPMSDFINGDVGELPKWNGNVFLKGHMGLKNGAEISPEMGANPEAFTTKSLFTRVNRFKGELWSNEMDAREMGRLLRDFSMQRNVDIKSVVAGGCHGSRAARRIGEGFAYANHYGEEGKREARFLGLKEGNLGIYHGPETSVKGCSKANYPIDRARYYAVDGKGHYQSVVKDIGGGRKQLQGYKEAGKPDSDLLPFADGEELRSYVNGRAPRGLVSKFERFLVDY